MMKSGALIYEAIDGKDNNISLLSVSHGNGGADFMTKLKKPEMVHPQKVGDKAYLLDTYAVCSSIDNSSDRKCGQPKFGVEVTVDKLMTTGAKGKDDIKVFARIRIDSNDSIPLWTPIQNLEVR